MGKVLFVLELPEPKLRKEHAPPGKRHKDATKYSRKQKHKARLGEAPDDSGASFFSKRPKARPRPTTFLFAALRGAIRQEPTSFSKHQMRWSSLPAGVSLPDEVLRANAHMSHPAFSATAE